MLGEKKPKIEYKQQKMNQLYFNEQHKLSEGKKKWIQVIF